MKSLLLHAVSILAVCCTTSAAPKLTVESDTYDAGTVIAPNPITHSFSIQNSGDEPLLIQDVKAGCGCTSLTFTNNIAPGDTGKVGFTVNTRGMDGHISKHVTVFSNDPDKPSYLLHIEANVKVPITAEPAFMRFRNKGDSQTTTFTSNLDSIQKLEIETVRCMPSMFEISHTPISTNQVQLTLTITNDLPKGSKGNAFVKFKNMDFESSLYLHMNMNHGVEVSPKALTFFPDSVAMIQEVQFSRADGKPITPGKVVFSSPLLTSKDWITTPDGQAILTVEFAAHEEEAPQQMQMIVSFEDPNATITIPISYTGKQ